MKEEGGSESDLPEKKAGESKEEDGEASPVEPEVLKDLPPDVRKAFKEFSLSAFSGSVPVFNPILKKVTERHIDKVLDLAEKDSQREYNDTQSTKKYNLIYALIIAALFVFTTIYLVGQDKELYKDLLVKLIIYLGGVGSGYGIKVFRDRAKD